MIPVVRKKVKGDADLIEVLETASSRSMVFTLPRMVLRIEFLSLVPSPVNITPTMLRSVYQPMMSVSLLEASRDKAIVSRVVP